MLSEFVQVEADYGEQKGADLRRACRYLLRNQFVFNGRGLASIYDTLTDARFRRVIGEFFDSIGYSIRQDDREQWVGIMPMEDDATGGRLRIDATICLLVVAAHWQAEIDRGEAEERAVVRTTFNILYERYKDAIQKVSSAAVNKTRFLDVLRELGDRHLVSVGDEDRDLQDREVDIRPMIKLVSGDDALKRIETYVRQEIVLTTPEIRASILGDGGTTDEDAR
ncbi:MAG: hypothetical protein BGO82_01375 [Devosia sp. 67-54]|uniref:DUF4194 domain-containing protein n=1 Tax=unclassified Devosia TaxID=196773 RepID=UPI000959B821|nr:MULTISPECIES: DUF4194 domain-containing protein [unclassified Devosia]MBN9305885.1 DUF4194 domain-containing protein [Devosia sp.]OJX16421.1 MAG: hypothetical protein BGO82_01375 [Devosia sp. 67-54]